MNLFESMLLIFIFILFPLCIYLLYELFAKTIDIKRQSLFLDVAVISSIYLIIRYDNIMYHKISFVLIMIPLFISYTKKREIPIFVISTILIGYYHKNFSIPVYLLVAEFLLYYLIYVIFYHKNTKFIINIFFIIRTIFLTCWIFVYPTLFINDSYRILILLSLIIIFITIYEFTIYLFTKTEKIIDMQKMVNKVEEAKAMYQSLFKVTHEIKNPIAVCKGYLDMFDVNNIEHSRKYIPILKSEVSRLLVLLEDFLSINRIKIEKDILDIDMLIEEVCNNFKPILDEKNIVLDYESNDELFIEADYNRIKQVLVNLIKNSIESIVRDGTIKINYKIKNNKLLINITDDGIGMDSEELEQLNTPFYTTKSRGTGLGVYLSKEIMKAHDGSIEYKSRKNKGTTAIIKIPMKN